MHTKIKVRDSVSQVLHYHEKKVKQAHAECLYARNMLKEADQLTTPEKQFFFDHFQAMNDRVKNRTLDIIISWNKDDVLDNEKMRDISKDYMKEMGLDQQPYLVYRHRDALHDHVHIISTRVRHNGQRIDIGRTIKFLGLRVARELEKRYGLYQAGKRLPDEEWARLYPAQPLKYGVTPLKPTMNAVLDAVIPVYKYTSLNNLNAILRPYKIQAIEGKENTTTREHNGLFYVPTDGWGGKEIYIKASALRSRPTLKNLQRRFAENQSLRETHRQRLTTAIDWIFNKQPVSMEAFREALQKEKILIMDEQDNKSGQHQVFYVDHLARTVWDAATLGQRYSAEGIKARCVSSEEYRQHQQQTQRLQQRHRPDLE